MIDRVMLRREARDSSSGLRKVSWDWERRMRYEGPSGASSRPFAAFEAMSTNGGGNVPSFMQKP